MMFTRVRAVVLLLLLVVQSAFGAVAFAGIASSARLQLSTHTADASANHEWLFVTPTGVDDSGDEMVLRYASGFDLTGIDVGDIDLAIDDDDQCDGAFADKTLAASAGAGTWGVTISGQTVTFAAPTDAASGEITAGRCVQVQIGTTASGGVHQIANPVSTGSYMASLYGSFGDVALVSVGVTGTSGVTVSARVGSGSTIDVGGGGDTGPTEDTTAPVISNILVQDITETSARITWTTSEPALTTLSYGPSSAYELGGVSDSALRTSHERVLGGLTRGTLYHFLISAQDDAGNVRFSADETFTTLDTSPLEILEVSVSAVTSNSALLAWKTNRASTAAVTVGTERYIEPDLATVHELVITGLAAGRTYLYRIDALDAIGMAASATGSIATLADVPPSAPTNLVAIPGDQRVTLTWTNPTDVDFDHVVLVYTVSAEGASRPPVRVTDGHLAYTGPGTTFLHTGLMNGAKYYYSLFAVDAGGQFSSAIVTSAIPTGPTIGTDTGTEDDSDTGDESDTGGDTGTDTDTETGDGSDTGGDTGLPTEDGRGIDSDGETGTEGGESAGETGTGTEGTGAFALRNLIVSNIGEREVTLTWDTTRTADGRVTLLGGATYLEEGSHVSHRVRIPGLQPDTGYEARVVSQTDDGARAEATIRFRTGVDGGAIPDGTLAILNARALTDVTRATLRWETTLPARSTVELPVGTFSRSDLVMDHEMELTGLAPNTLYVARIRATSRDGATAEAFVSFQTTAEGTGASGFFVEPEFLVAADQIALSVAGQQLRVLPERPLAVRIVPNGEAGDVVAVRLTVGDATYLPSIASTTVTDATDARVGVVLDRAYVARILTPRRSTTLVIEAEHLDGTTERAAYDLFVVAPGVVTQKRAGTALSEALITLLQGGAIGDMTAYGQTNPWKTDASGAYGWYVPNGIWQIRVAREGYVGWSSAELSIEDHILAIPVMLYEELPPLLGSGSFPKALAAHVGRAIERARDNTAVQTTARVATPVVAVAAVSTAGVLVTGFNALPFLQYLFSAPFLLIDRRRRKRWGVVYDSLRKLPIDLVIVRLLDAASGRVVKSAVTDKQGRYLFLVGPGEYRIDVRKVGFTAPSLYLRTQKRDGDLLDLYHGEPIRVTEEGATITANIPMDAQQAEAQTPSKLNWHLWKRRVFHGLSLVGVLVALGVAVIQPSVWTIALVVVQITVLLLFLRLAIPAKPKNWGIVYDHKTRRPLAKTIVRIFDPTFNKLLETQVTDARGRYAFLVGPSQFYATYDKSGYAPVRVDPIDRTDGHDASYVTIDVGLTQQRP